MKSIYLRIVFLLVIFCFIFAGDSFATLIVLDPGHGGTDPGAINGFIQEKDITLQLARYLRDYLKEYDADVVLTHEGMWGYDFSIYDRAMVARDLNADLLVSLHFNSGSSTSNGSEVWVSNNKSHYKYNQFGTELGNKVLNNLSNLGLANRGVKIRLCNDTTDVYPDGSRADYYGIIRYAMRGTKITNGVRYPEWKADANLANGEGISTILIEHCFMQGDLSYIDSDWDLLRLAQADGQAIVSQLGLRKQSDVVESVTIDKQNLEMFIGDKFKLSATVLPGTALNKKVLWSSSDSSIVSVDANGNISANKAGKAIITVKTEDGNKTAQCEVYVEDVLLGENDIKMCISDKRQVIATLVNENSNRNLIWSSADENIVTVSQNGLISAVGEGNTNVSVKIDGTNIYKTINVEVHSILDGEYVKVLNLKEYNGVLTGISEKTSKKELLDKFEVSGGLELVIESDNDFIGSDTKVIVKDKKSGLVCKEYVCLVYGDVNGDGMIKASDYVLIKNHIMEENRLVGNKILAADVNDDGAVKPGDYVSLKNYIMQGTQIRQE